MEPEGNRNPFVLVVRAAGGYLHRVLNTTTLQLSVGGVFLDTQERMIRVISYGPSVVNLVNGILDVTRTGRFETPSGNQSRDDDREASETYTDTRKFEEFFESLHEVSRDIRNKRRSALLNNSYLSCWFRSAQPSDIETNAG